MNKLAGISFGPEPDHSLHPQGKALKARGAEGFGSIACIIVTFSHINIDIYATEKIYSEFGNQAQAKLRNDIRGDLKITIHVLG